MSYDKETLISYANNFLIGKSRYNPAGYQTKSELDRHLGEALGSLDTFWPHWIDKKDKAPFIEKLDHVSDDPLADLSWLFSLSPLTIYIAISEIYPEEWKRVEALDLFLPLLAYESNYASWKFDYYPYDGAVNYVGLTIGKLPEIRSISHSSCIYLSLFLINYLRLHYPHLTEF